MLDSNNASILNLFTKSCCPNLRKITLQSYWNIKTSFNVHLGPFFETLKTREEIEYEIIIIDSADKLDVHSIRKSHECIDCIKLKDESEVKFAHSLKK